MSLHYSTMQYLLHITTPTTHVSDYLSHTTSAIHFPRIHDESCRECSALHYTPCVFLYCKGPLGYCYLNKMTTVSVSTVRNVPKYHNKFDKVCVYNCMAILHGSYYPQGIYSRYGVKLHSYEFNLNTRTTILATVGTVLL